MKRKWIIAGIVLLLLIIPTVIFLPSYLQDDAEAEMRNFVWHYPDFAGDVDNVYSKVINLEFTDMFLSTNARLLDHRTDTYDPGYTADWKNYAEQGLNRGIDISMMILQDPDFYNDSSAAIIHLQGIEAFLSQTGLDISGIHYDIEPHASPIWDNEEEQQVIFIDFIDTLIVLGEYIANSEMLSQLEVSIAVPWWFNEKGFDSRYPDQLADLYDFLVFMVYGGIGDELKDYERIEDELSVMPGVLGIGVNEFNTTSDVIEFRGELQKIYHDNPTYIGTSIFKLGNL